MTVLSIHEVEIVHSTTKERRTLRVYQLYAREIGLQWPLVGVLRFYNRSGIGIAKAKSWSIAPESLKKLHTELKIIGPPQEWADGQQWIK